MAVSQYFLWDQCLLSPVRARKYRSLHDVLQINRVKMACFVRQESIILLSTWKRSLFAIS
jgi:hypothetical protein